MKLLFLSANFLPSSPSRSLIILFWFLGLHLWHMEVPRLGVKSELQLPAYTTATATPDLSCVRANTIAHVNAGSLTHWVRPGIEPAFSWIIVGFITHWATRGTPSGTSLLAASCYLCLVTELEEKRGGLYCWVDPEENQRGLSWQLLQGRPLQFLQAMKC